MAERRSKGIDRLRFESYERLCCDSLYSLKNSPVEVLTITLYKHYPCRGYPYRKEALITDLMFSWNSHTPDLWGVLYKDDLFLSLIHI